MIFFIFFEILEIFLDRFFFLIIPGFITDTIGFLLLIPFTRKALISIWLKKRYVKPNEDKNEIIEAEIVEEEKDKNES